MATAVELVKRHTEAINERRWDLDDVVLDEEYTVHFPWSPEPIRGRQAYRAAFDVILTAFPDLRVEIHEVLGNDERAMSWYTETATHTGPHPQLGAPTGRTYVKQGFMLARQENSRLVESWCQEDDIGFLLQLGLIELTLPGIG
jgi:predicted ester cyclase